MKLPVIIQDNGVNRILTELTPREAIILSKALDHYDLPQHGFNRYLDTGKIKVFEFVVEPGFTVDEANELSKTLQAVANLP